MYLALAPRQLAPDPRYPYALHFYCLYVCVDLLCLVFLIRAGVALWRLQPRGRWLSNLVLVFEVVWSLIQWEIFLHSPLVGKPSMVVNSMQVAYGVSTAGAEIQILTVYPLIALIAINLAYRRLYPPRPAPGSVRGDQEGTWKPRPRTVLRVLGVLNIVVALWGLNVSAVWYLIVMENGIGVDATRPYVLSVYRVETAMAVFCFLIFIPIGFELWHLKRQGWWISCGLLLFTASFFLVEQGIRFVLVARGGESTAWSNSIAGSTGSLTLVLPLVLYQVFFVVSARSAFQRLRVDAQA
jgi:hypothetical protein